MIHGIIHVLELNATKDVQAFKGVVFPSVLLNASVVFPPRLYLCLNETYYYRRILELNDTKDGRKEERPSPSPPGLGKQ